MSFSILEVDFLQKQPPELFCKKRPHACNVLKKETLAQVFSYKFCEICKNTFLQNTSGQLLQFPYKGKWKKKTENGGHGIVQIFIEYW